MENTEHKKVGNTSFHVETIKKMKLKDFKDTYRGILKGQDLDKVYTEVTGKSGESDKPVRFGDTPITEK